MYIKKILLPLNYSSCSLNALNYAASIANKFEAKLLIVHSLDDETSDVKERKSEQIKKINDIINNNPQLVNIMTDIVVTEKAKKEAILWANDTFDIDLVIMGTDGIKSPYDELAGTFTYQIVSDSDRPVLTIPPDFEYKDLNKIGFGVDFKLIDHTSALDIILEFAYAYNSELEMFHIEKYTEEKELLEVYESAKLNDYFDGVNHNFITVKNNSLWEGLERYLEQSKPDLLVVMPRKYSFFEWLSHKSLSREVVQHIKLPVLTFPEK